MEFQGDLMKKGQKKVYKTTKKSPWSGGDPALLTIHINK